MRSAYALGCLLALSGLAQAQTSGHSCPPPPSGVQRPWLDVHVTPQCRAQYVLDALGGIDAKLAFIDSNGAGPPERRDPWREVGLFALRGNDGPAGNTRAQHVTAMPNPLTVAASFDPAVAIEYGKIIGEEFHATGNSVMIGPAMDIARTWRFGRTPESFGEDPFLAASLVGPEVQAIQRSHILATLKHYAAYTQEQGRTGDPPFGENPAVNVLVAEQALREMYLAPFRAAVEVGRAGSVMCAFPRINGTYACENPLTLGILKTSWGFDGTVVPDFPDAQRSVVAAINAGLDSGRFARAPSPPAAAGGLAALFSGALPGHDIDLPTAVSQGKISEERVDDLIRRRLTPAFRLGVFENPPTGDPSSDVSTAEHRQAAREIVSRGAVLLKNRSHVLPLDPHIKRLAVIGAQAGAAATVTMLGSGYVEPTHLSTAIDAIRKRAGTSIEVHYAAGTLGIGALPRAPGSLFRTPAGAVGLLAQYFPSRKLDFSDAPLQTRVEDGASVNGSPAGIGNLPPNYGYSVRWRGTYTPTSSGTQRFSIEGCGSGKLLIDGRLVAEFQRVDFGAIEHAVIGMTAGHPESIEIQWTPGQGAPGPAMHMLGTTLGTLFELGFAGPDSSLRDAVTAARHADVAVVFVANRMGEGADRLHLNLPGDQAALIAAVAKVNPRTVVVLNTGAAVSMPWLENVAAVLEMWYPGDAMGAATADLLFGDAEPSGRLPLTFPASESQGPGGTAATYPGLLNDAGMLSTVSYSEGSNVGYRYFEKHDQQPLFPFGFGLSYTSFKWSEIHVSDDTDGGATITATVENVGHRRGRDTVEVYAVMPDQGHGEPPRQLKGIATVDLKAGASQTVRIKIGASEFAFWSGTDHAWRTATGNWRILVGRSSADIVYSQFLPISSHGDEPAAGASTAPTSALVSNPCPAPPSMPPSMANGLDRLLVPGKPAGDAQSTTAPRDVQEYLRAVQEQARNDWPNLCRYRAANASLSRSTRVVFMGDSITEFWARADSELFRDGVIGRGISGQTSPQMLLRFFQDVVELHPRIVHIMAGTNDLAGNTGPSSAQDFKNNIMAMVELAHTHKIRVVLASIPPTGAFPWRPGLRPASDIVALNKWLRSYAEASGSQYVDYYSVLADSQGGFQMALSNDGVHPNRDGYMRMRALALKALAIGAR